MAITSAGVGSNLPIDSLISQLMQSEALPLTALAKKEASYQAKVSAFGSLSSALGTFQTALAALKNPSTFRTLTASSSDTSILSAAASGKAAAGSYNINVTKLAQAQSIASAGQVSTTASIGAGGTTTLTFQLGTITGGTLTDGIYSGGASFAQSGEQATGTVTINNNNNSLQGIRDAINAANLGVTATIVNDGSDNPNHLVLTSTKTGATSSMKISVSGDAAIENLLAYDPAGTQNLKQNTVAQSAALTINGIAVSSPSNSINDALEGISLSLSKVGTSNLTVSRSSSALETGVTGFVKAYNDLNQTLKNLTTFNGVGKANGELLGDSTVQSIQAELRRTLSTTIDGLKGDYVTLGQIGVSFQKDGALALDTSKLQTAISKNPDGVGALFAEMGSTTDSLVDFVGSTKNTKAGSYALNITQIATQANMTGDLDLSAGSTVIAPNTSITMTIDGIATEVALAAGSYTAAQLAALLQSSINGTSKFVTEGVSVSASITADGFLNIQSKRYGSASNISMNAAGTGTGIAELFGSVSSGTAGVDVAGTINGVAASGSGQTLTGAIGSPTEGIKLNILGGVLGARGDVNFTNGYANRLDTFLSTVLGSTGLISGRTDGLARSIKDIGTTRDAFNAKLVGIEARYRAQFTALDIAIGKMSSTSSFLTQQLAQIANLSKQ